MRMSRRTTAARSPPRSSRTLKTSAEESSTTPDWLVLPILAAPPLLSLRLSKPPLIWPEIVTLDCANAAGAANTPATATAMSFLFIQNLLMR